MSKTAYHPVDKRLKKLKGYLLKESTYDIVVDLIEQARQEAYKRGYKDGIKSTKK